MAIKMLVPMTTLPTANEQTAMSPITVTATGVSREYPELGSFSRGLFLFCVTAASGTTPTLDVVIQGYDTLAAIWRTVVTFAQQTAAVAAGVTPQTTTLDYESYRAQWTVAGTSPSFTFTLGCVAHSEEPA